MNIKSFFDTLIIMIVAVFKFLFSADVLITLLFLIGLTVVLYTIYSLSFVAFSFVLGAVLIAASLLLYVAGKQK